MTGAPTNPYENEQPSSPRCHARAAALGWVAPTDGGVQAGPPRPPPRERERERERERSKEIPHTI